MRGWEWGILNFLSGRFAGAAPRCAYYDVPPSLCCLARASFRVGSLRSLCASGLWVCRWHAHPSRAASLLFSPSHPWFPTCLLCRAEKQSFVDTLHHVLRGDGHLSQAERLARVGLVSLFVLHFIDFQ